MKMIQCNILLALAGLALIGTPTLADQPGRGGRGAGGGGAGQVALTSTEASDLLFMREEEKLARDVYLNLFECWGVLIFANIANSEQAHMDALKGLLDKYGLADPAGEIGVFSNPELQDLYDLLAFNGVAARIVTADSRGELVAKFAFAEIAAIVEKPSATMILDATSTDGTPIVGWCEVGVR